MAGGGIGGLAAAVALARTGARVCVLERARSFGEVGAGLQLAPNATRVLNTWGLGPDLARIGFEPFAAEIRDRAGGALLLGTALGPASRARWGAPYLQVHRADLHGMLLVACEAAGVELRTGSSVTGVEALQGGVRVQTGEEVQDADVLIGADGIRSHVRAVALGATPSRFTGHIAWRALVPADAVPPGLIAPAATVWTAPGAHVVHYFVRGGALVNFAGFTRGRHDPEESWRQAAAAGEIASLFRDWPPPVRALTGALERIGATGWRSAVHDREPQPRWSCGRIALLGDAAHPMPPYLAQGAGMAVEDAEALARHLAGPRDPAAALRAYAAERFSRVRRVQAWATRNATLFHLPTILRRAAFAAARATGGAERLDWLYGHAPPEAEPQRSKDDRRP